ncbi:MAG: hypothetical protein WBE13_19805 [Candidatus Acidiferrum sp.]
MKSGRLLTWTGSVILFLTGIGHSIGIRNLDKMIVGSGMKAPLDVMLKACWLGFGAEMLALAVIAVVASGLKESGRIVLLCAATMVLNAGLLLHFMGPFIGVYASAFVALLYLTGGWTQVKVAT